MEEVNPAYVLVAIIALCAMMIVTTVVLAVTGHSDEVVPMGGVVMPMIAALVGLKVELVKRQLNKRMDGVYQKMHDEVVTAKEEAAKLKGRLT